MNGLETQMRSAKMDYSKRDDTNPKNTGEFKRNQFSLKQTKPPVPIMDVIRTFLLIIVIEIPKIIFSFIKNLNKKPKLLKDKICLVTGAGRGLGRQLCIELANLGGIIVCVDIREDINNETIKLIRDSGGKAYGYTCNIVKQKDVTKLADTVKKEVGRVYLLLNNAALIMAHHAGEWPPDEVISMYNVNVISHYWMIQAFLPEMKEVNDGHIVSILSAASFTDTPNLSVYAATKAAAESLLNILRLELNNKNDNKIVVTGVYPSVIKTNQEITDIYTSGIINFLSVEKATELIIQGILYDQTFLVIPKSIYWFAVFYKILPDYIKLKLFNALDLQLNVPSKENKENIPFNCIKQKCLDNS